MALPPHCPQVPQASIPWPASPWTDTSPKNVREEKLPTKPNLEKYRPPKEEDSEERGQVIGIVSPAVSFEQLLVRTTTGSVPESVTVGQGGN